MYGGTKTEMERLLADAEKLTGVKYDISNLSDVYQAIHVIQSELGITGTTAKEASTTIQGSVASMKSAWQNLLTGMADENANHKQLVQNFVNSIIGENGEGGVIGNIVPRIRIMIDGLKTIFSELWNQLPKIAEQIPEIKPLVDILTWIKSNGPVIISILAGIGAAMAAFKIASVIIALVNGFKTFFAVIKAGQGIMAALNIVMNANPIGLIVMAIAGLVTAFITLWNTSEDFRETLILSKSKSSKILICFIALSTIFSCNGISLSSKSFSKEPALTPIRIGIFCCLAKLTTFSTFSLFPMFPGFRRSAEIPLLIHWIASL